MMESMIEGRRNRLEGMEGNAKKVFHNLLKSAKLAQQIAVCLYWWWWGRREGGTKLTITYILSEFDL